MKCMYSRFNNNMHKQQIYLQTEMTSQRNTQDVPSKRQLALCTSIISFCSSVTEQFWISSHPPLTQYYYLFTASSCPPIIICTFSTFSPIPLPEVFSLNTSFSQCWFTSFYIWYITLFFFSTVLVLQLVQNIRHDDVADGSGRLFSGRSGLWARRLLRHAFLPPKAAGHRYFHRNGFPERRCDIHPPQVILTKP